MSLSPPRKASVGDVWVEPFTADRYIYTASDKPYISRSGAHLDAFDGWERWELANERHAYLADRHTKENT